MKQQKQIHNWLVKELGKTSGERIADSQKQFYQRCVSSTSGKSKSQMKTLRDTVLPRIALYKALQNDAEYADRAYEIIRKYMIEVVGRQKHDSTSKMEIVPGFYEIYSRVFLNIMKTTDLQKSTQSVGNDHYDITITNCLWNNACVENGCPELCRAFCEVDDITYGGLKKLGFTRTQTLGMGGCCCDFHFYKKK
ncbi:MAG: L-2-amino-thiazoline-4-carboxylic acid hydrolase [Huintestinicola sp.]